MVKLILIVLLFTTPLFLLGGELPSQVFDLSQWKITLPVDDVQPFGSPDEVKQPALVGYVNAKYFFVEKGGVVFRAPCGGATTKNSKYPRCELREMSVDGKSRAAWDTSSPVIRTMTVKARILRTPKVKQHVVCAQIHDWDDDLMMVRLEGTKLFIERNKIGDVLLRDDYKLGDIFTVKIQAGNSRVRVWYNGKLKMDWKVEKKGCYFKVGCYTQSNLDKGDKAGDYGEVTIYKLQLETQQVAE